MFSPLRNRFGIPGVISVIALVFAMMGGAYAATSNGGKATASAKAKKGPRGPKGPTGPAGAAGPAGSAGPAGAKGDKGDTGAQGNEGPQGKEGKQGPQGKPGTTGFTKTLPPGETETGAWALGIGPAGVNRIPISFNIPLAENLSGTGCGTNPPATTCHVHYINESNKEVPTPGQELVSATCHGSVAEPTADPGNLCVYTGFATETQVSSESISQVFESPGASKAGAVIEFLNGEAGNGLGSWAVTEEK